MTRRGPAVVVGASLAGAKAALALRRHGWDEGIVLVGEEGALPYERPQLSKGYLGGSRQLRHLQVASAETYDQAAVELVLGARATAVLPGSHQVELADGRRLDYGALLICTGAAARRPWMPGGDLPGVHVLRTVEDAERLRAEVSPGTRVVVLGMGLIGSEVAATLRGAGAEVVAVDPFPTPLFRAVAPTVGQMLADLHRHHGVRLLLGRSVAEIIGRVSVEGVVLEDGERVAADVVVAGLGAVPSTALAMDAGIRCGTGILTDASGRTSAPDVYAAGDVAEQYVPHRGRRERVEHWKHAVRQAENVAAAVAGTAADLDVTPWFWTDQYDLHLEVIGWPTGGGEVVVEGTVGRDGVTGDFMARTVDGDRVLTAAAVGRGKQLRALARQMSDGNQPAGAASLT